MIQIDDKELEQETKGMRIYGWESRNLGKGRKKLYINEDAPSERELAKRGLAPKVRNVWSLVEE